MMIFFSFQTFADKGPKTVEVPSHEISNNQLKAGAVVGTVIGFGMGHLIQDRYSGDKGHGFLFTLAEPAPFGILLLGSIYEWMLDPCSGDAGSHDECSGKSKRIFATEDALKVATAVFLGIKIWEIVDVWSYSSTSASASIPSKLQVAIVPTSQSIAGVGLKLEF